MPRFLFLSAVLLFLSGCVTTAAPPYSYLSDSADDEEMVVGARAVHGIVTDKIYITVNGEDVLAGSIRLWRLQESLAGAWQGRPITADCFARNANVNTLTQHFCTVVVDEHQIIELSF